jgi:hypothetical protein
MPIPEQDQAMRTSMGNCAMAGGWGGQDMCKRMADAVKVTRSKELSRGATMDALAMHHPIGSFFLKFNCHSFAGRALHRMGVGEMVDGMESMRTA